MNPRRALRWTGRSVVALIGLVMIAVAIVYAESERRPRSALDVGEHALSVSTDSATIGRGRHVADVRGCTSCHGPSRAGSVLLENFAAGRVEPHQRWARQGAHRQRLGARCATRSAARRSPAVVHAIAGVHAAVLSSGGEPHAGRDWKWSFADFERAMREGRRPDGTTIRPPMPIKVTRAMSDVEVAAVWAYLRSLPPRGTND